MPTLQQLKAELEVAYQHHWALNFAASSRICRALLQHCLPPITAVECHIMLLTERVPEALDHSVSANIIARNLLEEFPDAEDIQELYMISQDLLRLTQQEHREQINFASHNQPNLASQQHASSGSSSLPVSPPHPPRRYGLSNINTNLETIPELPEGEPAIKAGPSGRGNHNRRPSSLYCAAGRLARSIGQSRGN